MKDEINFGKFGGTTCESALFSAVNEHDILSPDIFPSTDTEEYNYFGTSDAVSATKENDEFGQFEGFPTTASENVSTSLAEVPDGEEGALDFCASPGVPGDENFGTFGDADPVQNQDGIFDENVLDDNRDNFDAVFDDFSSFDDAAQHQKSGNELNLQEIVCTKFGAEFSRLVGDWENLIVSAVKNDLQEGNKNMDHLSNNLSSGDRAFIVKSRRFRDYIFGLAEFVRVVRSITATIGDLSCVGKNVDVNLPQWHENEIIADVIHIENLWSEIISKVVALGISPVPKLESVVDIRARAIHFDISKKSTFCHLTLRPLKGELCTLSPVIWRDKAYMACAANFCANRVPAHAI